LFEKPLQQDSQEIVGLLFGVGPHQERKPLERAFAKLTGFNVEFLAITLAQRRVYQCEMASDVWRCGTRRRCDNSSEVPRSKNDTDDELLRPIRPNKRCGEGLALSQHSTFYIPKKYISSSI